MRVEPDPTSQDRRDLYAAYRSLAEAHGLERLTWRRCRRLRLDRVSPAEFALRLVEWETWQR